MKKDFYFADKIYSAPDTVMGGAEDDETPLTKSTCQVIYDIYDSLLKTPYFTKKELGEAFGRKIYNYTFKNFELENFSEFQPKKYKMLIITSIHGYEQGCAWTAAQFFKELCKNKDDEVLSFIRRNVTFEIIPVLNPWGFDHNDRKNGNQVDLNRNFPQGFMNITDVSSEIYSGTEPFSEKETQIVKKFIEENSDAQVVLDYHNIWGGYPLFYVYGEKDVTLAKSVFSYLTDKWVKEYPEMPKDRILGLARPNGNYGMLADFLLSERLWVLTLETPWCMPHIAKKQYDKPTIKCALEVLVNTVYTIASNT